MRPELFNQWIDALESGEYKKGKYYLKDNYNQFCCLGVLCDLLPDRYGQWSYSGLEGQQSQQIREEAIQAFFISDEESKCDLIPPRLASKLGITEHIQRVLAELNDLSNTFKPVINYLKNQKNLFVDDGEA
jgi:hypothetical protein